MPRNEAAVVLLGRALRGDEPRLYREQPHRVLRDRFRATMPCAVRRRRGAGWSRAAGSSARLGALLAAVLLLLGTVAAKASDVLAP